MHAPTGTVTIGERTIGERVAYYRRRRGRSQKVLAGLRRDVGDVFDALPGLPVRLRHRPRPPRSLRRRARHVDRHGADATCAQGLLALTYQAAASVLTKLGEADLAWIASERGLTAARQTGSPVILGSLFRSMAHALLSTGRYPAGVQLTEAAADVLQPQLGQADPSLLSIYGSLSLTGAVRVDASPLPVERQVRHAIETARAFSAANRHDEALGMVLDAEQLAPEQVKHHVMSRNLVLGWVRAQRGPSNIALDQLARRLHLMQ